MEIIQKNILECKLYADSWIKAYGMTLDLKDYRIDFYGVHENKIPVVIELPKCTLEECKHRDVFISSEDIVYGHFTAKPGEILYSQYSGKVPINLNDKNIIVKPYFIDRDLHRLYIQQQREDIVNYMVPFESKEEMEFNHIKENVVYKIFNNNVASIIVKYDRKNRKKLSFDRINLQYR